MVLRPQEIELISRHGSFVGMKSENATVKSANADNLEEFKS